VATASDVSDAAASELEAVRALFGEYASSLPFPLDFQDFAKELATLPGEYTPPGGALLVARLDGSICGCVGVRRFAHDACELKRLYVRPEQRSAGIGRILTEAAIARAKRLGYKRMLLDTVPGMERAQALYLTLGFREIDAYRANPVPGARFLELALEGYAISGS
jgi:ribosomal protein S18 acetylase RimI-like enzyme